jgi:hypothetical protein
MTMPLPYGKQGDNLRARQKGWWSHGTWRCWQGVENTNTPFGCKYSRLKLGNEIAVVWLTNEFRAGIKTQFLGIRL